MTLDEFTTTVLVVCLVLNIIFMLMSLSAGRANGWAAFGIGWCGVWLILL